MRSNSCVLFGLVVVGVLACEPPAAPIDAGPGEDVPDSDDACPGLRSVQDGFLSGNCQLATQAEFLRFLAEGVTTVEGRLILGTLVAAEIELPDLVQAGSVSVGGNRNLRLLALPVLESADVNVGPNAALTELDLSSLRIGSLEVNQVPLPDGLFVPALEESESFRVAATTLPTIEAPALQIVTEALSINENTQLTTVSLPSLTSAASVEMFANELFAQCSAEALVAALDEAPETTQVFANREGCDCSTSPPVCE